MTITPSLGIPRMSENTRAYDVVVVGATRAGIAAANEALQRDLAVCLLDAHPVAGIHESLWLDLRRRTGFLRAALENKGLELIRRDAAREIWSELASCDQERILLDSLRPLSDAGVVVLRGSAHFVSPSCLELADGTQILSRAFVIATGTAPRRPGRFRFDDRTVFDSQTFLRAPRPPRSVVIVGADWTGCEWANMCCSVGAKVTLIDRRSRLLRALDAEVRLAVQSSLHEMGVDIVLEEEFVSVNEGPHGGCCIRLASGRNEVADRLLVLAGSTGNTHELELAELGVQLDAFGHVLVDDCLQSSVEGIFAIGSVIDPIGLAPSSLLQASVAVSAATGETPSFRTGVPWVLHSSVEVAMCGLTEEACAMLDIAVDVGRATSPQPSHHMPHLAKVVVARSDGRILGAQMVGPGAAEAIHVASESVDRNVPLEDCAQLCCTERTMAELYWAALQSTIVQRQRGAHSGIAGETSP